MRIVKEFYAESNCGDVSNTLEAQINEYANEHGCTVISISLAPTRFSSSTCSPWAPVGIEVLNILEYTAYVIFEC